MNGLATAMQGAGILVLAEIVVIVLIACILTVVLYGVSHKEGRFTRMKARMKTLGFALAFVTFLCWAGSYYQDARIRAHATHFDTERSRNDGGRYTAQYAYLGRDRILLRLYRTSDMRLLAERTYEYPDAVRLVWTKESLIFDTAVDSGGEIKLPPTHFDRFTAMLP
ncbi:hypothetical protein LGM89_27670 [Burkholderia sp. AU31624]|uniref:hypothetical protein n=1 Tax=Burkholderia sp. AU31624 TaxID=2879629 RepID=UPI001CF3EAFF|nr:hypothetical protein [Burkholderia sp. AU31624]MCA8257059.1 hypothetical protein [Burkholderia sp. AU31624]